MKRLFFYIVLTFLIFGLAGCGNKNTTSSQSGTTPLPGVGTLVAETLAALNLATPSGSQASSDLATPTLPAPTTPAASKENLQNKPPTATASPTSTESPPKASPTATAVVSPEASPTATAVNSPEPSPTAKTSISPVASPTPTAAVPPNTPVSADDCIDKAGFYGDVTVPDNTLFPKNTEFTKTWRFKNVGTCTWDESYQLVFANGQIMGGPPSTPLSRAAPGEVINVSVNLKSPAEGGTYAGDWQFRNPKGKRFGVNSHGEDMFWVIIKVDWGPGIGPTPTPPPVNCAYERNAEYEAQILHLINTARAANGLPVLTLQNQLSAASLAHSADMACHSNLDHTGSDKSNHSSRVAAKGYKYAYESENIYAGGTAQDAFDWWMNSAVHRANILSSKISQIGIGYAYYASSKFGGYYTLNFARPK